MLSFRMYQVHITLHMVSLSGGKIGETAAAAVCVSGVMNEWEDDEEEVQTRRKIPRTQVPSEVDQWNSGRTDGGSLP